MAARLALGCNVCVGAEVSSLWAGFTEFNKYVAKPQAYYDKNGALWWWGEAAPDSPLAHALGVRVVGITNDYYEKRDQVQGPYTQFVDCSIDPGKIVLTVCSSLKVAIDSFAMDHEPIGGKKAIPTLPPKSDIPVYELPPVPVVVTLPGKTTPETPAAIAEEKSSTGPLVMAGVAVVAAALVIGTLKVK